MTTTTETPQFRVFTRNNMAEIPQLQALPESERIAMSAVSAVLPFRVNRYVLDELIRWSDVPNDPMFQLTFPQPEMLARDDVARMTELLLEGEGNTGLAADNTRVRQILVKEEHATMAKDNILVIWTDYFKPPHLEKYPDLHEKVWMACQLGSQVKIGVNMDTAVAFKAALQEIGDIFWETKA